VAGARQHGRPKGTTDGMRLGSKDTGRPGLWFAISPYDNR
jgi:hypothetical protein